MSDSKQKAFEQYQKVGDAYVRSESHAKGEDLEHLLALANPQKDWQVLDVATGGGHTALTFAPFVNQVVATDLTPNMLETAGRFVRDEKGIKNVDFQQADAENLPFEEGSFDLVTCRIAPHHFPDCQAFVNESARVLKPGGLLLVQDQMLPEDRVTAEYVDQFERVRDPSHHRAYPEKEWREMFAIAGLLVEETVKLVKRHDLADWAGRMNNTDATLQELIQMIQNASGPVVAWMNPLPSAERFDAPGASFCNHHLILSGRK